MFNPVIETARNTADFGGVLYPVHLTPVSHYMWDGNAALYEQIAGNGDDPYGRPYYLGDW